MESILQDLSNLAEEIKGDRAVHVQFKELLLESLESGEGLVDTGAPSQDDIDGGEDDIQMEDESSLFVEDNTADFREEIREDQEDSDGDPDDDEPLQWINNLGRHITNLHSTTYDLEDLTPCPGLAKTPQPHQLNALARIEYNRNTPLKTTMIGDDAGLGKTFPAMMAVVKAVYESAGVKMPSIIVVPSSCVPQWKSEFEKFFKPDTVQVFVLRDPNTSPLHLMKFDVILTSYGFVMNQYRKMCQYVNRVEEFKQNGQSIRPLERPSLSIFSEIFYQQYTESNLKFPYLILDEVTAIKNCDSITFGALRELRMLADACVMLTGSVVDNTWFDLFAFIRLVLSHTIDKRSTMISLFASRNAADKIIPPRDTQFCRLIQLLNSFVVRRPEITIDIPELVQEDVTFELSDDEASQSNHNFDKYQRIMRMNSKDAVQIPGQSKKLQPWKYLTRALQHACHPRMVDIMHFARNQFATNDDEADADRLYEAEDIEKWLAWREELTKDDNWKSSRVTAIIDTFNKQRDLDPFCAGLIFDESVYFLDIVQIAFSQMYDPVECLRYDGRETPEKRILILQEFEKAAGKKVLLISRGAGGVGLNITAANVVILCSPWWKVGWEKQAIKRAHRTGQKRKVWAGRVVAANCDMDLYKARTRDKKNRHNAKIMDRITRKDGEMPRIWNDFV